ncbi:MAG: XcyI family restriction endonuclease, partial [Fimbriimonadales bacterium]|nr:XcyI family restriction endonuclease [Fimbriimonadales bacterium]
MQEQQTKSLFFLAKLQEWGLQEVATAIEQFDGSSVNWNLQELRIAEKAWNRVIHRGIMPVRVFAHPVVLQTVPRSVGYYRMLAMVSQKSMKRVHLDTEPYETGSTVPDEDTARMLASHLNTIISRLVEQDVQISPRGLDLWRGMAAGSQAQGSWQNAKGTQYETIVQQILTSYLQEIGLLQEQVGRHLKLQDGRTIIFGSDPDISLVRDGEILSAVEIKGGIDPAGAHERLGAALKTLRNCKAKHPKCVTILLLRRETLTQGLEDRIQQSSAEITHWFALEDVLGDEDTQSMFIRMFLQST